MRERKEEIQRFSTVCQFTTIAKDSRHAGIFFFAAEITIYAAKKILM